MSLTKTYEDIIYEVYAKGRDIGLEHKHVRSVILKVILDCRERYQSSTQSAITEVE